MYRYPALGTDPFGEADVVRMGMCQDDRADVRQGPPHRRQLGRQVTPVAGRAGVDDGHFASFFHEIDVDEAGSDATDTGRDLHRRSLAPAL